MFITNVKAEDLKLTENALKMDGSQIYLKAGEKMTVNDLIKAYV
jgi:D-alanyl-D-alanine carboxypeptidase